MLNLHAKRHENGHPRHEEDQFRTSLYRPKPPHGSTPSRPSGHLRGRPIFAADPGFSSCLPWANLPQAPRPLELKARRQAAPAKHVPFCVKSAQRRVFLRRNRGRNMTKAIQTHPNLAWDACILAFKELQRAIRPAGGSRNPAAAASARSRARRCRPCPGCRRPRGRTCRAGSAYAPGGASCLCRSAWPSEPLSKRPHDVVDGTATTADSIPKEGRERPRHHPKAPFRVFACWRQPPTGCGVVGPCSRQRIREKTPCDHLQQSACSMQNKDFSVCHFSLEMKMDPPGYKTW